ncbi:MAG: transposase [Candidatus Omnitrophica bacterium]|nr:transposase [Candidatus Omnitrophota bacterium]
MSKTLRLALNNTVYHINIRGNQKQETFKEDADFKTFLSLLKHYKIKYHFKVYGYCPMPNHAHLILETKKGTDLSKFMQGLSQTYTMWFNKKYDKVGHLWQGRYKSKIIQKDKYLLDCIQYVELNPIRAGICKSPFDYPWSSWQERHGYKKRDILDDLKGLL